LGGERESPVTMNSARHPTESAGPQAALRLISSLNTKHRLFLLPCRALLALTGFATCSRQSPGIRVAARSPPALRLWLVPMVR
jgi:hypothetical protein